MLRRGLQDIDGRVASGRFPPQVVIQTRTGWCAISIAVDSRAGHSDGRVSYRVATRGAVLNDGNVEPIGIHPMDRVPGHVSVGVDPAIKTYRIRLHIPPDGGVIVAEVVLVRLAPASYSQTELR